jgi:hypothetical protein
MRKILLYSPFNFCALTAFPGRISSALKYEREIYRNFLKNNCIHSVYSRSTKALGKYHINKSASNYRKVRDGLAKFSLNSPCRYRCNLPFRVVLRPREWGWVSCPLARAPDAGLEPESNLVCPEGSLSLPEDSARV